MATAALVITKEELDALLVSAAERGAKLALDARGHADEWLDQTQAAVVLKVARSSIPLLVKRDGLPCSRLGRIYKFKRAELDAWLAARSSAPPNASGPRTLRSIPGGR